MRVIVLIVALAALVLLLYRVARRRNRAPAPSGFVDITGFDDPGEMEDAIALAAISKIALPQSRLFYEQLVSIYGQDAVNRVAGLVRSGKFRDRYPSETIEQALDADDPLIQEYIERTSRAVERAVPPAPKRVVNNPVASTHVREDKLAGGSQPGSVELPAAGAGADEESISGLLTPDLRMRFPIAVKFVNRALQLPNEVRAQVLQTAEVMDAATAEALEFHRRLYGPPYDAAFEWLADEFRSRVANSQVEDMYKHRVVQAAEALMMSHLPGGERVIEVAYDGFKEAVPIRELGRRDSTDLGG